MFERLLLYKGLVAGADFFFRMYNKCKSYFFFSFLDTIKVLDPFKGLSKQVEYVLPTGIPHIALIPGRFALRVS